MVVCWRESVGDRMNSVGVSGATRSRGGIRLCDGRASGKGIVRWFVRQVWEAPESRGNCGATKLGWQVKGRGRVGDGERIGKCRR